jgi:hypothetical protein
LTAFTNKLDRTESLIKIEYWQHQTICLGDSRPVRLDHFSRQIGVVGGCRFQAAPQFGHSFGSGSVAPLDFPLALPLVPFHLPAKLFPLLRGFAASIFISAPAFRNTASPTTE